MNCAHLIFCLTIFLIPSAHAGRPLVKTHTIVLEKPEVYGGVTFPAKSRLDLMEDNKTVYYAWPGADFQANGITIRSGTQMMLHGNGKVQAIWTVADQKILNTTLPLATWVTFRADGSVEHITTKAPFDMRGLKAIERPQFYRNGNFRTVTLTQEQIIDGLKFKKGEVDFHSNGRLMKGVIAESALLKARKESGPIKEVRVEPETRVYFDEKGILVGAFPRKSGSIEFSKELHPDMEE